ncbi:putative toxin-antitoxin system toxin component, PIN family [Algoriphagus terrigena]|uniref:putative toxin-antitoxin system toxin component, PIN family n=1 Tax=Algoriphagus terrigena TaxID=344884 RepID=UPI00047D9F78|nr:putative toxin-antitoxin system toxin component, PIN family [Algoriphagus terrigena]
MKVVIDTNILLVSISSRSPHHWIFQGIIRKHFDLVVSTEILAEYAEIIQRHIGNAAADSVMAVIENLENLTQVSPVFRFNLISTDPDDNKFVDCAIASNADFILTEDRHMLELKRIKFPKVSTKNIEEFKSLMGV